MVQYDCRRALFIHGLFQLILSQKTNLKAKLSPDQDGTPKMNKSFSDLLKSSENQAVLQHALRIHRAIAKASNKTDSFLEY